MGITRRTTLKLGLGAGTLPLITAVSAASDTSTCKAEALRGGTACPLPLTAVKLTGGPLKLAQERNAEYLRKLEPDRMLAFYRQRAGLSPRAQPYGGWDGGGRNLTGHIAGHYLSAVSLMWAATGEAEFRQRADYVVDELRAVQDAQGNGYVGAIEGLEEAFARLARGDIDSQSFDLNGLWSPWYTLHKTYAGLRDAWRYAGNRRALEIETSFAAWAERVLRDLDHDQLQHMLNTEFGGMNDVLVDLYEDTGEVRWLALSKKFEHDDFLAPLRRHCDNLADKHGNTAVPKLLGSANRYSVDGAASDLIAASFFWDTVVAQHTFATGGHGKDEYFGPPGKLSARLEGRTAETCNVYNMLKLSRRLFAMSPDARYADFHERALFNHILGSMDPEDGSTCYMVPVGSGVQREYQDMFQSFTCCVGTGMESHALHGDGIYVESGNRLYVNLYVPTVVTWSAQRATLVVDTDFPLGNSAAIRLELEQPRNMTLSLRRPDWAGERFAIRVNGEAVALPDRSVEPWRDERSQYVDHAAGASAFVDLTREWQSGDIVEIDLPKALRIEPTTDNPQRVAIMWGPLVLAGDLGPERRPAADGTDPEPAAPTPVLVAADRPVDDWIAPVADSVGRFRTVDAGRLPVAGERPVDVELAPFYSVQRRRYAAYWDFVSIEEWQSRQIAYAAEAERLRDIEAATVAFVTPGAPDSERDFNYRGGDDASRYQIQGRSCRRAKTWFAYDLPVEPDVAMQLMLDLYSDDRRHSPAKFAISIDGERLAEYYLRRSEPPRFFDVRFDIPKSMVGDKRRATIRFDAAAGSQVPAILGVRVLRVQARDRAKI